MKTLDWIIITLYALGMLAVGFYYSKKTTTIEDYLLGGRHMSPPLVGLSLFATLISTISYLSLPGEVIQHGPMILCQLFAYPFVFLVIGFFIIPFIMKLKVTTAYEILETRLGLSIRLLGSFFFLLLRVLWMAVIIYATTSKVLIPVLDLDPQLTPWICAAIGVLVVIYTSMGGLRAVVITDVVQSLILFTGAILTLIIITISMGGVGEWWPHSWADNWQEPRFGFETDARISLGWILLSTFTWYVCTTGSDQMAIQRYLATKDVKAARYVLFTSLFADVLIMLLLGALGFALLAYFQANTHMVPDGQTVQSSAEQLLPRYIVYELPPGISGLLIAGLLAAAMSSLSSGVNSSCSVITRDFIDRFRREKLSEFEHMRYAKLVSLLVGAVVVGLSFYVSIVPGNLLEVAFRVVNLLVAPLFMLFFMAVFIPWATTFGTWTAAVCSTTTAVLIAYWELFTGQRGPSFLLIMPVTVLIGIITGMVASLIPIGPKARPMLR